MGLEGKPIPCVECTEPQTHDRHIFEEDGRIIGQYCDDHCPRCDMARSEQ